MGVLDLGMEAEVWRIGMEAEICRIEVADEGAAADAGIIADISAVWPKRGWVVDVGHEGVDVAGYEAYPENIVAPTVRGIIRGDAVTLSDARLIT